MKYKRPLALHQLSSSCFVFGPRMTGKTTLLKELPLAKYYDLLNAEIFLRFNAAPEEFLQQLLSLPDESLVAVDEIQRIPILLDAVQITIEQKRHRFILTGSSARTLKRKSTNRLGGRALDLRLHPFTAEELAGDFDIDIALQYGTMPKPYLIAYQGNSQEATLLLLSYLTTYIEQEIRLEALTRNLGSFQRFLNAAGYLHAGEVVYANVSKECQVPMSTVKEYFSILEDTLLGIMLWQHGKSEKNKSRGKFYFFDPGVVRAIQNRLYAAPSREELGHLFEGWFINELHRIRDYRMLPYTFSFWKDGANEMDVLVELHGRIVLAFELKTSDRSLSLKSAKKFKQAHPEVPTYIVTLEATAKRAAKTDITITSWKDALEIFGALTAAGARTSVR
jgi:uncharacterized protein